MENAALLFNFNSRGHKLFNRLSMIKNKLNKSFKIDIFSYKDNFDLTHILLSKRYKNIFLCGGDGSFSSFINLVIKLNLENDLNIGYFPLGTMNDCLKMYGISSINKSIKYIKENCVVKARLGKCEDIYFTYVVALGAYSDISYRCDHQKKKIFGRFAYYFLALKECFKKQLDTFIINGKKYESPFVMVMLGSHIGGFKVNKYPSNDSLKIFITPKGLFNGLLHYIFRKKLLIESCNEIIIKHQNPLQCVDGEFFCSLTTRIVLSDKKISIFGKI